MADLSFDEMLSKITSDPSIMAKISEIAKDGSTESVTDKIQNVIATISPSINNQSNEKSDTSEGKIEDSSNTLNSVLPNSFSKLSEKISKNQKLLLALKPYLSKERCEIVDSIVKMAQVADLMKIVK